jgi:hypothetical protein
MNFVGQKLELQIDGCQYFRISLSKHSTLQINPSTRAIHNDPAVVARVDQVLAARL